MAVVELDDVSFSYAGRTAVESVSFSVSSGAFFGLVGPNGSGKTTLLKLILGILRPDGGQISIFGEPVDSFRSGERLAYVPQQSTHRDQTMPLTVREVVAMGRYPHRPVGRLRTEDTAAIERALQTVDIETLANRRFSQLSGGQTQRVLLARAVAADAALLVLDEPTVGVDSEAHSSFFELLDRLNSQGLTTILVDHDVQTVRTHADRIACLNRSLSYLGPADEFDAMSATSLQSPRSQ